MGIGIAMVKEYTSSSGSLSARLTDVSMEIDDDDEDVILVILELSNESAVPLGGVDVQIKSSSGATFKPREEITSLSPGSTRAFSFEFRLDTGTWTFSGNASGMKVDMGPFDAAFEYTAPSQRRLSSAVGSSLFTGAFDDHFSDYGNVKETELINPDDIQVTQYTIESASGGNQTITKTDELSDEPEARVPPWMQNKQENIPPATGILNQPVRNLEPQNSADLLKVPLSSPSTETTAEDESSSVTTSEDVLATNPQNDILLQTNQPAVEKTVSAPTPPAMPTAPISSAPTPPSLPSKSTDGASSRPSNGPASGPPTGPPTGPPSGPPSGPPYGTAIGTTNRSAIWTAFWTSYRTTNWTA